MEENKNKNKNKKKDRKGLKFNILDLIIIIAVLFVAVIAVLFTIPKVQDKVGAGEKIRISYTVVFENIDELVFDQISKGQTVTSVENGVLLGTVSESPEAEPAYTYVLVTGESGENTVKKQEDPSGKRNITVTVEADAVYSEGKGYTIDGYRIAVGKEFNLRFPNYTDTGYCTGITVIGNN